APLPPPLHPPAGSSIYLLSRHDALPIYGVAGRGVAESRMEFLSHRRPADHAAPLQHHDLQPALRQPPGADQPVVPAADDDDVSRSEEHTSELQSRENLVCRLLLEKKNAG